MVSSIATILNPDKTIWGRVAIPIDDDSPEDEARIRLMDEFARGILGPQFVRVSANVAWNIWQAAELNGFAIQVLPVVQPIQQAA